MDKRSLFQKLAQARAEGSAKPPVDHKAMERYPTVYEFLTRTEASPELLKELASISIRMGIGEWVVVLSDPGFAVTVTASAETLDSAFAALEDLLTGPNPPIQPWKGETGALKPRKRRREQSE